MSAEHELMRPIGGPLGVLLHRLDVSGHSCPAAGGTVGGDQNGYVDRVARALGVRKRANISVGGATACWPSANANGDGGFSWVLNNFTPPNSGDSVGGYLPHTSLVIPHFGFEDLAALGSGRPAPFREALRTIISRYCTAALYEAETDASWAFAGGVADTGANSWTYSSGRSKYFVVGGGGANPATQWGQFTTPADYPGNEVVAIGLGLLPGAVGAGDSITLAITIDGGQEYDLTIPFDSSAGGWADSQANKANGIVLRIGRADCGLGLAGVLSAGAKIPALTAGAHTIRVACKNVGPAGAYLIFDYAQIEADPLDGPIVLVPGSWRPLAGGQALWNGWAHGYNAATDPMTDAKILGWNAHVQEVLADFPGRSLYVDVDGVLAQNPAYFSADGIHPSNRGHAVAAKAVTDAFLASGLVTSRLVGRYSKRTLGPYDGGVWHPIGGAFGTSIGSALSNTWAAYGSPFLLPAFRKDLDGHVYIRGVVKQAGAGAANSKIHDIPDIPGYRIQATKDKAAVVFTGAALTSGQLREDPASGAFFVGGGQTAAGSFCDINDEWWAEQ